VNGRVYFMDRKSVGLKILFYVEAIIAIRVLLFSIPVMINKYLASSFLLSDLNDCFIAVMTVTALLYLIVGVVSIFGYRYWKTIHYLAAFFTLIITVATISASRFVLFFSDFVFCCYCRLCRSFRRDKTGSLKT